MDTAWTARTGRRIAVLLILCLPGGPAVPGETPLEGVDAAGVLTRGLAHFDPGRRGDFLQDLCDFVRSEFARVPPGLAPADHLACRKRILDGLCLLFDADGELDDHWVTRQALTGFDLSSEARRQRKQLGVWVAMQGRNDAVRHFFLAAALTRTGGPALAELASREKEIRDARRLEAGGGGEGFSFLDLAFDVAGTRFACAVLGWGKQAVEPIPHLDQFLPRFSDLDLPTHLTHSEFKRQYAKPGFPHYRRTMLRIHAAIDEALAKGS